MGPMDVDHQPFNFAYPGQAAMAGFVDRGARRPGQATPATHEPLPALAQVTFRIVRGMAEAALRSTGVRLEDATLRAAREAAAGHTEAARAALAGGELLPTAAAGPRRRPGAAP